MTKVIDEAYHNCIVGDKVLVTPDYETQTVQMFQVDVGHAEALERKGYIAILDTHEENETGFRYIDSILIRRLK